MIGSNRMALAAGAKLCPSEIFALLGAGPGFMCVP
jgi:hypothetical protein